MPSAARSAGGSSLRPCSTQRKASSNSWRPAAPSASSEKTASAGTLPPSIRCGREASARSARSSGPISAASRAIWAKAISFSSSSRSAGTYANRGKGNAEGSTVAGSTSGSGGMPSDARSAAMSAGLLLVNCCHSNWQHAARSGTTASPAFAASRGVRFPRYGIFVTGQTSMTIRDLLLVAQPAELGGIHPIGRQPLEGKGQRHPRDLVDDLRPGMRGRDRRAGEPGEPRGEGVELAVVVGLERDDLAAEGEAAEDAGDVGRLEAGPLARRQRGAVEQGEPLDRGRLGVVGVDRRGALFDDVLLGAEGLQQAVVVAERPDELDELDPVVGAGRADQLAEGLEVDGLGGRAQRLDGAAERPDRPGVVGHPEPAEADVAVGLGALHDGRERLERGGRRRPEARLGPAERLVEPARPLGVEARRGRARAGNGP